MDTHSYYIAYVIEDEDSNNHFLGSVLNLSGNIETDEDLRKISLKIKETLVREGYVFREDKFPVILNWKFLV